MNRNTSRTPRRLTSAAVTPKTALPTRTAKVYAARWMVPLWTTFAVVSWAALPGCESNASGFLSCGSEICGPRQICGEGDGGLACVCDAGYQGARCDVCARGYRRTLDAGCELIPIDCATNPGVCGQHGTCTSDPRGDVCSCEETYTGRLCDQCTPGYQDNNLDGSCEPSCKTASIQCELPRRCNDSSGSPICVCPKGYTGETCQLCSEGYREVNATCVPTCETAPPSCGEGKICQDGRTGPECVCPTGYTGVTCRACAAGYVRDAFTGVCFAGCATANLSCGERGQCSEDVGFAYCRCDLGYSGADCTSCADGYVPQADETCRFVPPPSHTLLAEAAVFGTPTLVALDPATGDVLAVGEQQVGGLAQGLGPGRVFTSNGRVVSELDLTRGEASLVAQNLTIWPALTWDSKRGRLLSISIAAPYDLVTLDRTTGNVSTALPWGTVATRDLAYDAARDRVLVLGAGLSAIDLETGAISVLPDPPPATRGITFGADGTLYALAATTLAPDAARIDACRRSAAGLGIAGYGAAIGSVVRPSADDVSVAIDSQRTAGAEVLAYLGQGVTGPGPRVLSITSDNADAVICLELREATQLSIAAASRFLALVAYTAQSDVTIDVESGFSAARSPAIHLGATSPRYSVPESTWIKVYDRASWTNLALPIDPLFYAPGPGVLHTLDESFTSISSVQLPTHVRPLGTLTAWVP